MEDKKYSRNLQHLQAQFKIAHEQKKSLNLAGVKNKLKDYEQMLQYYTLKMKDSKVELEEWW
jgi:hypothetical protein